MNPFWSNKGQTALRLVNILVRGTSKTPRSGNRINVRISLELV